MIPTAISALVSGIAWRLRGGAFTTLTRLSLGTDFARLLGALGVAIPLVMEHGPASLALVPATFLGLLLTGWGPFQGMGEKAPYAPEKSWLRWLPLRLGLPIGSLAHDAVGMAQAGVVCVAPIAAVMAVLFGPVAGALTLLAGPTFTIAYLIPRLVRLPTIPRFASGQAWGEVFVGVILGALTGLAAGT